MHQSRLRVRRSKSKKAMGNAGAVDRLSTLPDSVLSHILSYLPTKNAVATSILSQRWKYLWTAVSNLSFDDRLCRTPRHLINDAKSGFGQFVQTVIERTNPVKINKFSVHCCRPIKLSTIDSWVTAVLMRSVREIELCTRQDNRIELPNAIARSTTLEVLKLEGNFVMAVPPDGNCFPALKVLNVCLQHTENSFTEKMFCSCPVLEDLSIKAYLKHDGDKANFIIASTMLKKLALTVAIPDFYFSEFDHAVTITAPNLECLHVTADVLGLYVVHDLHCVNEVKLDISYGEWALGNPNHVVWLLEGVSATKSLTVSAGVISALHEAYEQFKPSFPQLTHLEMTFGAFGWRILPIILGSSSIIETIVLEKECWFEVTEEDFSWLDTGIVPECLVQQVKKIEVNGVDGDDDERPLLEYLLQYTAKLETMVVRLKGCTSNMKLRKLQRKLQQLRRGSDVCEIDVL